MGYMFSFKLLLVNCIVMFVMIGQCVHFGSTATSRKVLYRMGLSEGKAKEGGIK